MPTNDFLPFGTASGANVLPQASYSALAVRPIGFQSGLLPSVELNKPLRQASIMAAVLAQFIADESGADYVDDGTTATLLANLKTGVSSANSGRPGHTYNPSADWCYLNLAIGLKMQWLLGTIPTTTGLTSSFITPFTSVVFGIIPIKLDSSAENIFIIEGATTLTQFSSDNYPGAVATSARFLAFGI